MTLGRCTATLAVLLMLAGATHAAAADPSPAPSPDAARTVTTASGLRYVDTQVGSGAMPKPGQTVAVHYVAMNGPTRIEGSPGGQPFEFQLGKGQALKGLEEGVSTMKVGGKRTLIVPPELGYGIAGVPGRVPPNATLTFEVELVAVH